MHCIILYPCCLVGAGLARDATKLLGINKASNNNQPSIPRHTTSGLWPAANLPVVIVSLQQGLCSRYTQCDLDLLATLQLVLSALAQHWMKGQAGAPKTEAFIDWWLDSNDLIHWWKDCLNLDLDLNLDLNISNNYLHHSLSPNPRDLWHKLEFSLPWPAASSGARQPLNGQAGSTGLGPGTAWRSPLLALPCQSSRLWNSPRKQSCMDSSQLTSSRAPGLTNSYYYILTLTADRQQCDSSAHYSIRTDFLRCECDRPSTSGV